MKFQPYSNHHFHIPEKQNPHFSQCDSIVELHNAKISFIIKMQWRCLVLLFVLIELIKYSSNTWLDTIERCERCRSVTYSHGVGRVSEVGEGAEGRQRRLREGHRALWRDEDRWRQQHRRCFPLTHRSCFFVCLLVCFSSFTSLSSAEIPRSRLAAGPQLQSWRAAGSAGRRSCPL